MLLENRKFYLTELISCLISVFALHASALYNGRICLIGKGHKQPNGLYMMEDNEELSSRRSLLKSLTISSTALLPLTIRPRTCFAEDISSEDEKAAMRFTIPQIASFLSPIPIFTIVDKTGTPFMVVGEDAKLTAYFFTSYSEAERILKVARESSTTALIQAKKEENEKRRTSGEKPLTQEELIDVIGINPWINARISTVGLDFAVALANRGKLGGAYFRLVSREKDVEEALIIDKSEDLAEGRIPIFYMENFEFETKEPIWSGTNKEIPLFFQKDQLINEWKRMNPNISVAKQEIKVTELFSVLNSLSQSSIGADDDLEKLVLVAPLDSEMKAKTCMMKGGKENAFTLGERIVVL